METEMGKDRFGNHRPVGTYEVCSICSLQRTRVEEEVRDMSPAVRELGEITYGMNVDREDV